MAAQLLLPTTYFGNVHYYAHLYHADAVQIEAHENFVKQTYRNRCEIYGANGKLKLIIPLIKQKGQRQLISEIAISHESDWRKHHWKSLESAYRSSPYFEYYESELRSFYNATYITLFEWNRVLLQWVCDKLEITTPITYTDNWERSPQNTTDLRAHFSTSQTPQALKEVTYGQVFENKHGFLPNLSILDVLFNEGPATQQVLSEIGL